MSSLTRVIPFFITGTAIAAGSRKAKTFDGCIFGRSF
jgi:hypothetical protein